MPLILKLAQPAPNQGQGSSTNLATSHVEAQLLSRAPVSRLGVFLAAARWRRCSLWSLLVRLPRLQ